MDNNSVSVYACPQPPDNNFKYAPPPIVTMYAVYPPPFIEPSQSPSFVYTNNDAEILKRLDKIIELLTKKQGRRRKK